MKLGNRISLSFFVTIFLIILASCSSSIKRIPSNDLVETKKNRHIIFTVHGLTGNESTFGYLAEATKNYLERIDPHFAVEVSNFVYPTGKSEKNGAYDFAFNEKFGLAQHLKRYFQDSPLKEGDKISFIAHSQGGIVTYMWFFDAIIKQETDYKYAEKVDSIITLGTPFWGSKIASILMDKRNPDVIPFINLFAPSNMKVTKHEIEDLAFSSETIHLFRTMAVKLDTDPSLTDKLSNLPVRLINISGILPRDKQELFATSERSASDLTKKVVNLVYKIFTKSYNGNKLIESDIAVPVSSSRWNFIYAQPKEIFENTTINSNEFMDFQHMVSNSKFLFTESAHLPFEIEQTLSMAYVNQSCLKLETCNHPTYKYILEELSNCPKNKCNEAEFAKIINQLKAARLVQNSDDQIVKKLQSFSIQVDLKLPKWAIYKFPVKYLKNKFNTEQAEYWNFDSWVLNEYELQGRVINLLTNRSRESIASNENVRIILADKNERHSIDIVGRHAIESDPYDRIRFNVYGRIETKNDFKQSGYTVPLEINLPGYPSVKINANVKPSFSSFVELDFSQYGR